MVKNLQKVSVPPTLLHQEVAEEPDLGFGFEKEIALLKSLKKLVPPTAIASILARAQAGKLAAG